MLSQQIERAIAEEAAIRSAATFKQLRIELIEAIDEVFDRITGTETKPEPEKKPAHKTSGRRVRRWHSVPEKLRELILIDVAGGKTRKQIAATRKVSIATVDRVKSGAKKKPEKVGPKWKRGEVTPEKRAKMIEEFQTEKSLAAIARDAGLGETTVRGIRTQWVQEEMEKKRRAEEERKVDTAQEMGQM